MNDSQDVFHPLKTIPSLQSPPLYVILNLINLTVMTGESSCMKLFRESGWWKRAGEMQGSASLSRQGERSNPARDARYSFESRTHRGCSDDGAVKLGGTRSSVPLGMGAFCISFL